MMRYFFFCLIHSFCLGYISPVYSQSLSNVIQFYSDGDNRMQLEKTIVMSNYKFLVFDVTAVEGNIFYADKLVDLEDPFRPKRQSSFIIVKTNLKNELIEARKYIALSIQSVTNSEDLLFFTIADTTQGASIWEGYIIGIDEDFNTRFSKKINSCNSIKIFYRDKNLYIQAANRTGKFLEIGQDTIKNDYFDTHSTIKLEIESEKIIWVANAGREQSAVSPIYVNSSGEVYVYGYLGYGLAGAVWLQGDTLSVIGDQDGYIYKLDKDGKKIFLKQIFGADSEWIANLTIDMEDNIYMDVSSIGSSGIKFNNNFYQAPNSNSLYGSHFIIKIDKFGNEIWVNAFNGQWAFIHQLIPINTGELLLCLEYETLEFGNIKETERSGAFVFINRLDGVVTNFVKLKSNSTVTYAKGVQFVNENLISCAINLFNNKNEPLILEGREYTANNTLLNFSSFIADIDFSKANNLVETMDNSFNIFPNPVITGSELKVYSKSAYNYGVKIYDGFGRIIDSVQSLDNLVTISLDKVCAPGLYFIEINYSNRKILKELYIY